jgi:hypothetical protein
MKQRPTFTLLFLVSFVFSASADIIPPTLNWEAALDTNGNNLWESSVNPDTSAQFTFVNGAQSPTDVSGSSNLPGVQSAYAMPGAHGDMSTFSAIVTPGGGSASARDATFELVFRPTNLSTNYYLFETGGSGSGMGIFIFESNLVFRAQQAANDAQDAQVSLALGPGDLNNFHQVVATIDLDAAANANSISLYVNGALVGSDSGTGVINNFAGGDISGIGNLGGGSLSGFNNSTVAGMFNNFDGDIALLRYYDDQVFNQAQVTQNYNVLLGIPEPTSLALVVVGAGALLSCRRRFIR